MDFYCAVLVIVALSVYAMDLESHNIKPIPILFLSSVLIFSLLLEILIIFLKLQYQALVY